MHNTFLKTIPNFELKLIKAIPISNKVFT